VLRFFMTVSECICIVEKKRVHLELFFFQWKTRELMNIRTSQKSKNIGNSSQEERNGPGVRPLSPAAL
jgi:hypothetical protein